MNKAWVQAAIDVEDLDLAKQIAFMALDAGADWLEVGTPLLYKFGYDAIGTIRKAVGKEVVLVVDYKISFGMLVAEQVARQGANYLLISADYEDKLAELSIKSCKQFGITPIFNLDVRPQDMGKRAAQLAEFGAEYVFSHHYSEINDNGEIKKYDNISTVMNSRVPVKLGITSDDFNEAKDAVKAGVDWIVFGVVLRKPNAVVCKQWIDMIHNSR